jgi:hypothetical protein
MTTPIAVNSTDYMHRILVKSDIVTGVRALVEVRLNVKTSCGPFLDKNWYIDFVAPKDVDLDFLCPDVLPPKVTVTS